MIRYRLPVDHSSCVSAQIICFYTEGADVESSPAVADETVWVGSYDRYVYTLYTKTVQE